MITGIPHLPWRDEDARVVPLGAFGLQVTSFFALGGYGVEWVASPGVSDLPPLVPKAPLQEGLCVVLDQLPFVGIDLPPLGLRTLNLAFGSGVVEGRHGQFPFRDSVVPRFGTKWPLPIGLVCSVSRLHGDGEGVAQAHRTEDSLAILFRQPDRALQAFDHTAKGPLQYDESMVRRAKSSIGTVPEVIRAVGYRRVSTIEQADSGAGLAAQQTTIEAEAARRGWVLVEVHTDEAASGKSLVGRVALEAAIEVVESGRADVLVVAKLDRLSRSLLDFANLMARAQAKGWNLVALDLGIDLSTPAGEFLASVMASAAQWERRIIGQRTREGMAAKKAAGVRLGPPRRLPDHVARQIIGLRSSGIAWVRVAEILNELGVPTALAGRQWYPSTARNAALAYQRDMARIASRSD